MAINGIIGILGGVVNVEVDRTFQLAPAIVYDYVLNYETPPSAFSYESSDTSVATVGVSSAIVAAIGAVGQTCQITIDYVDDEGTAYQDIIDVIIRPQGWYPPGPPVDTDDAQPENILKGKKATVNGEQIVGTAECYVENNTLYMPDGLISVSGT